MIRIAITFAFGVCISFGSLSISRAEAPDSWRLLLFHLLDLDQRALFASKQLTPLAELKAWEEVYEGARKEALIDDTDDRRHLKRFLLAGWIAQIKGEFATIEAFNTDFMTLFETRTEVVLQVLKEQEFMLPAMCVYLAKFFFFENSRAPDRVAWFERQRAAMENILTPPRVELCAASFWSVHK